MKKDYAYAIELPYWQAPNDYVHIESIGDSLIISFPLWRASTKYSRFKGVVEFTEVWATRYERNKDRRYYTPCGENDFASCYWVVPVSSWLEKLENERTEHFTDWKLYDSGTYTHYIVQCHDFYIEIIAKKITISRKLKK
ncbi:hypothetical protein KXE84_003606 [Escherichia fergusonii]|nr:hypothetical protein [Escherichia fergusonii]